MTSVLDQERENYKANMYNGRRHGHSHSLVLERTNSESIEDKRTAKCYAFKIDPSLPRQISKNETPAEPFQKGKTKSPLLSHYAFSFLYYQY